MIEVARKENGETVLISFWPHPRMVLNNDPGFLKLINTMEEKQELLRNIGIDHLILIPFTLEFAQTSSTDFIKWACPNIRFKSCGLLIFTIFKSIFHLLRLAFSEL